jgi:hypothetical protein
MKKLRHQWIGPFRVTALISPWVYEIEHLVAGTVRKAHISRLRLYADSAFEVTATLKDNLTFNEGEYEVDQISHIWMDSDGIYAKVQWVGFDDDEEEEGPTASELRASKLQAREGGGGGGGGGGHKKDGVDILLSVARGRARLFAFSHLFDAFLSLQMTR